MNINTARHSLAHILAYAVSELYPGVKFGIGPAIENGFYYDFDNLKISDADLPKIENEMKELIKKDLKFEKKEIKIDEAIKLFQKLKQPYKIELIKNIKKEIRNKKFQVLCFKLQDFIDLCKGPHIKSTKEINPDSFKLTKTAGAYWKGNEKNPMLSRIYGIAFEDKGSLEKYLKLIEESEKRDHRVLGQKLELFLIDEKIGAGLPIWLPNGAIIRKEIENYLYKELSEAGYKWLYTPHIGSRKLWETSGHWNFYNESMYPPLEISQSLEDAQKGRKAEIKEEYLLKPMNCPFHVAVYNYKIRSYRELPLKFAELGTVYRYERSGTLHGLTRVRGFTQDDAHLICAQEQISEELEKLVKHGVKMLKDFGFEDYNIYLSSRPEKYAGTLKNWNKATETLECVLKKLKLEYQTDRGGGVFYGPKIDIKIKDSLEREWQCTTIQFDFNLPDRFKMSYIDQKGKKKEPYMLHRALLGSIERFFGVLIEHYSGALPLWLSPVQLWIVPIGSLHQKYANQIGKKFQVLGFKFQVKDDNETVSKKIRDAENQKIPYVLVVGNKEIEAKSIRVRERGKGDIGEMKIDIFIEKIQKEIQEKKS